jgi:hypothetical protein
MISRTYSLNAPTKARALQKHAGSTQKAPPEKPAMPYPALTADEQAPRYYWLFWRFRKRGMLIEEPPSSS